MKNLTWVKGEREAEGLDETSRKILAAQPESGTSIFDPVLCELLYSWFCPPKAKILDPFAGGSVRGIVAAKLGHKYIGVDLSKEQVSANEEQAKRILKSNRPRWIVGDSMELKELAGRYAPFDFVFSCPPYYNLEIYSDADEDLSNYRAYSDFLKAYRSIIAQGVGLLGQNRFACFVVGNVRDKKGFFYNLVGDTVSAFESCGARFYNDAVLVTAVGSLPLRVNVMFGKYRKLGKTHQNVLVFYKGANTKRIPIGLGTIGIEAWDKS